MRTTRAVVMSAALAGGCGTSADPEPADQMGSAGETSTAGDPSSTQGGGGDTPDAMTSTAGGTAAGSTGPDFPPPLLDDCIDDGSPGAHVYTCEGFEFDVTIPQACLGMSCGVIVDVHGLSMDGQMQDANTNLATLGSERGYIVIQPNANPAPPAASWIPATDDAVVVDFMVRVADAFHADANRLHFTGFSQGGFMSWRVVCQYADILASVAPAAACGTGTVIDDCSFFGSDQPTESVDILYMHGFTDVLVPYVCAPLRVSAVVDAYGLGPERMLVEGDGYTWSRREAPDGTVLEFINHTYNAENLGVLGGHCYPGSDDPGDAPGQLFSFACTEPTKLHWGEAVVDFFDAHPRR